jgi:threonine/homoserine/homoserine lactone efflux protein
MWKKFVIIVAMALVHFGLSLLVVATSMSVATAVNPVQPEPSPILCNSFLWATAIYLLFLLVKMIEEKNKDGKGNH